MIPGAITGLAVACSSRASMSSSRRNGSVDATAAARRPSPAHRLRRKAPGQQQRPVDRLRRRAQHRGCPQFRGTSVAARLIIKLL